MTPEFGERLDAARKDLQDARRQAQAALDSKRRADVARFEAEEIVRQCDQKVCALITEYLRDGL